MKLLTKAIAMILCGILLIGFAGCSVQFGADDRPDAESQTGIDESVKGKISIYLLKDYEYPESWKEEDPPPEDAYSYAEYYTFQSLINYYRRLRPNVEVNVTEFDRPENYRAKLSEKLRAGTGPDVVFFSHGRYDEDFGALADENVLMDLNSLLSSDKSDTPLSLSDFPEPLTDLYVRGAAQCALPIDMSMSFCLYPNEILQAYGLTLPGSGGEGIGLLDFYKAFAEKTGNTDTPFVEALLEPSALFRFTLFSADNNWWNSKEKTARFNSPEFIAALKEYKAFTDQYPNYCCTSFNAQYTDENAQWKEKKLLYSVTDRIWQMIGKYRTLISKNELTYNFISPVHTAAAHSYISIGQNTKSADIAYDFIRFCLTSGQGSSYWLPANMKIFKNLIEYVDQSIKESGKHYDFSTDKEVMGAGLNDAVYKQLTGLYDTIETVYIPDRTIEDLIDGAAARVLEDGVSPEEAAEKLQSDVLAYLNS